MLAVKSDHKIDDEFATEFSIEFYSRLLENKSIISAFDKAKESVLEKLSKKNRVSDICCCAHDHKPWCEWYNVAVKNLGIDQVGSLVIHRPTSYTCLNAAVLSPTIEFIQKIVSG